jgi:hypothetical protein
MGQEQVYAWLHMMRERGEEEYYSTAEVRDGLRNSNIAQCTMFQVSHDLRTLARYGVIEMRRKSEYDWLVVFRAKHIPSPSDTTKDSRQATQNTIITHHIIPAQGQNCRAVQE